MTTRGGNDEATFQELGCPDHTKKRGYTKINGLCCLAAKNGFERVWIDTCCIDKTSSAALSKAINSMYRWYKEASICYAYLSDVLPEKCPAYIEDGKPHKDLDRDDDEWSSGEPDDYEYPEPFVNHFGSSRWFTRGLTLQELLAPKNIYFFNAAWKNLAHVPRIPTPTFAKPRSLCGCRGPLGVMRVEDGAYSPLGIFDVNMPLLYREGEKAFKRLQLEILKGSPDESMLAWRLSREIGSLVSLKFLNDRALKCPDSLKLLASSPQDFTEWFGAHIKPLFESRDPMMEMTNRGLRITLPLIKCRVDTYGVFSYMMDNTFDKVLAIRLQRTNVADEYHNAGLVTLSWQIVKKCQEKAIHCVKRDGILEYDALFGILLGQHNGSVSIHHKASPNAW
ncbi:HET domain-containing protein [Colletotrichum limetticola]|uniref:HET domain-containing protein n=1 Tax=Colletotrichum limetticola TaxID=1209924 RepID=A0ABQ9Q3I4_9PEZI|nr:HET domain-containing protein [Colletotrichum limetticola]